MAVSQKRSPKALHMCRDHVLRGPRKDSVLRPLEHGRRKGMEFEGLAKLFWGHRNFTGTFLAFPGSFSTEFRVIIALRP